MDCCESLYSAIFPPILAGVAGLEPTIRPKPRALPLGYTPVWSWWTDLNPRPADYKSAALPTELHQPYNVIYYITAFRKCQAIFLDFPCFLKTEAELFKTR